MAFGSGSSFSTDCSTRRSGSPASPKLCKFGCLTLLHQHSSSKPTTQSTLSSARCISRSRRLFSFVEGVGRGNPVLGSLPADPHPRKRRSDSLPANALLCESLLKTHLRGHLHRPQAAWLAELPGAPVKHLAQSLGPLLVEGPIDGVRAVRTSSQRLLEALLVDLVDGIACGLRIAAKIVGDLIGVLSIGAGKQDLATTSSEGIRRTQSRLQGFALGVTQRTHVDWWFHSVQDNH